MTPGEFAEIMTMCGFLAMAYLMGVRQGVCIAVRRCVNPPRR